MLIAANDSPVRCVCTSRTLTSTEAGSRHWLRCAIVINLVSGALVAAIALQEATGDRLVDRFFRDIKFYGVR